MLMATIQAYQPNNVDDVYAIWQTALGMRWPLSAYAFRALVLPDADLKREMLVASAHGTLVGFITVQIALDKNRETRQAQLIVLCVAPEYQRQGIGTALYDAALKVVRQRGATEMALGSGMPYLWPGIPVEEVPALGFFAAHGWTYHGRCYDMLQPLQQYRTPSDVYQRVAAQHILIEPATPEKPRELLRFIENEFPHWLPIYVQADTPDSDARCVIATQGQTIVGALVITTSRSDPRYGDLVWRAAFSSVSGEIGAVGVAAHKRGNGIGLALVAYASELLRDDGCAYGFIGWLTAVGFYGKLGYTIWQQYALSCKQLNDQETL